MVRCLLGLNLGCCLRKLYWWTMLLNVFTNVLEIRHYFTGWTASSEIKIKTVNGTFLESWQTGELVTYLGFGGPFNLIVTSLGVWGLLRDSKYILLSSVGVRLMFFSAPVVLNLLVFKANTELGSRAVKMPEGSLLLPGFSHFSWINTLWIVASLWLISRLWKF